MRASLLNLGNLAAMVAAFIFLFVVFDTNALTILINSCFVGAMFAIAVAYGKLIWYSFIGSHDISPRTRQYALTVIGQWAVIFIFVLTSVFIRIMDYPTNVYISMNFAKYLAICVAIIQVMTPDYGYSIFYGRDRKFLFLGIAIGILTAMSLIWVQTPDAVKIVPTPDPTTLGAPVMPTTPPQELAQ